MKFVFGSSLGSRHLIIRAGVHFLGGSLSQARCFCVESGNFQRKVQIGVSDQRLVSENKAHGRTRETANKLCYTALSCSIASLCSLLAVP